MEDSERWREYTNVGTKILYYCVCLEPASAHEQEPPERLSPEIEFGLVLARLGNTDWVRGSSYWFWSILVQDWALALYRPLVFGKPLSEANVKHICIPTLVPTLVPTMVNR